MILRRNYFLLLLPFILIGCNQAKPIKPIYQIYSQFEQFHNVNQPAQNVLLMLPGANHAYVYAPNQYDWLNDLTVPGKVIYKKPTFPKKEFTPSTFAKRFITNIGHSIEHEFWGLEDNDEYKPLLKVMVDEFASEFKKEVARRYENNDIQNGAQLINDPDASDLTDVSIESVRELGQSLLRRSYKRTIKSLKPWDSFDDVFQIENISLVLAPAAAIIVAHITDSEKVGFTIGLGFLVDVTDFMEKAIKDCLGITENLTDYQKEQHCLKQKALHKWMDQFKLKVRVNSPSSEDFSVQLELSRKIIPTIKVSLFFHYNRTPEEVNETFRFNQALDESKVSGGIEFKIDF